MTDPRRPSPEHDDPLIRVVAEYWDEIEALASKPQRERLLGLTDGTAEPDPAEARAALADELLGLLPPSHPVIRMLRAGIAFRPSGSGAGSLLPPEAGGPASGSPGGRIIAPRGGSAGTLPVTIYLADEHIHAGVEAAVAALLDASGLQIESRGDPVRGSWFLRMSARAKDGLRSPKGQLMENVPPLLVSLEKTKEAVVRIGALLVVKVDGSVIVSQLTPAQQLELDHNPELAMSPADIMPALRLGRWETAALDPGAGRARGPALIFGQPRAALVADDQLPPPIQLRPDLLELWLTGVAVPFGLEEPPEGCLCTEAVVRMTVDSPGVQGLWLTVPRQGDGAEDPMDDAVLDTWGTGTQQLTWKLTARRALVGLRPRGREILAVLASGQQTGLLTGTLAATVRFTSRVAGPARSAAAEPLPFTLPLAGDTAGPPPG